MEERLEEKPGDDSGDVLTEWEIVEHFGLDWAPQVVHRDVDPEIAGKLEAIRAPLWVSASSGARVRGQLIRDGDRLQLWYPADLPAHTSRSYRLEAGTERPDAPVAVTVPDGASAARPPLSVTIRDGQAELRNAHLGVRLSWCGKREEGKQSGCADPDRARFGPEQSDGAEPREVRSVCATTADCGEGGSDEPSTGAVRLRSPEGLQRPAPLRDLPAPVLAVLGCDGVWFGKGLWESDALCSAFSCEVVEKGEVVVRLRQSYELVDGGRIAFDYSLDSVTPAVKVQVSCSSAAFDGQAVWSVYESGAFEPTSSFWRPHTTDEWRGERVHHDWYRQVYELRWPQQPDRIDLTAFFNWNRNGAMFWSCWSDREDRSDLLLIAPIRPSETKCAGGYKPLSVSCSGSDGEGRRADVAICPQEGKKLFFLGMLDRTGALPEQGVPGSRVEGIYRQMQCLSLDDYHHMAIEWPGMERISDPHLMIRPDEVAGVRRVFREWPWFKKQFEEHAEDRLFSSHEQDDMVIRPDVGTLGSDWAGAYLASGDSSYAGRAKEIVGAKLDRWIRELDALGPTVDELIGISFARPWRSACIAFDLVAGSPAFSDEERLDFLRKFAFIAETASSGDAWPAPETGLVFPNPNFHPDYFSAKGISASLLTGHPRQREWIDYSTTEAVKFLRSYHHDSGFADEAPTYQFVSLGYMTVLATAVKNAGGRDFFEVEPMMKKSFDCLAGIQTPTDPRTGFAMAPTVGHVTAYGWCQSLQAYFGWAAKATRETDPQFSSRMMAAWRRAGTLPFSMHDWINGSIWWPALCLLDRGLPGDTGRDRPQSRLIGGLGAVFRSTHEDGEDGYLLVKMGPSRRHFDPDEGSLIWYAYGRPVLADFGCQYNPNIECAWLHNRISFGLWNDTGEFFMNKPEGFHCFDVTASHLGRHCDYICGEMTVHHLYRWDFRPVRRTHADAGLFPRPHAIDPITWRRQVLYVHDCEAVVILDDVDGGHETDWNLQVFAEEATPMRTVAAREKGLQAAGAGTASGAGGAVSASGLAGVSLKGQFGVDLDVHIAKPARPVVSFAGFEHLGFDEPRLPSYWWKGARWMAPEGTTFGPMGERAITVRVRHADSPSSRRRTTYLALLLARRSGCPSPIVRAFPQSGGFEWFTGRGAYRIALANGGTEWRLSADGAGGAWEERVR